MFTTNGTAAIICILLSYQLVMFLAKMQIFYSIYLSTNHLLIEQVLVMFREFYCFIKAK